VPPCALRWPRRIESHSAELDQTPAEQLTGTSRGTHSSEFFSHVTAPRKLRVINKAVIEDDARSRPELEASNALRERRTGWVVVSVSGTSPVRDDEVEMLERILEFPDCLIGAADGLYVNLPTEHGLDRSIWFPPGRSSTQRTRD
jgi:hypothetical protein